MSLLIRDVSAISAFTFLLSTTLLGKVSSDPYSGVFLPYRAFVQHLDEQNFHSSDTKLNLSLREKLL
jgi:hypothetical protein